MTYQTIDKFEYKYVSLHSTLKKSIDMLNSFGQEGWELFELIKSHTTSEPHQAILKRKIIEYTV